MGVAVVIKVCIVLCLFLIVGGFGGWDCMLGGNLKVGVMGRVEVEYG